MRRLYETVKNMVYPDPRADGVYQAMEQIRLDKEVPWKRSDWIALAILSLIVAAVVAFWPDMMMPQ
jgi:hypothetical protein